jgi:hypothetical protein
MPRLRIRSVLGVVVLGTALSCGARTQLVVPTEDSHPPPSCDVAQNPPSCADTTPVTTAKLHTKRVDKIDLLLMVDNSLSMDDKAAELGTRIPALIAKLTDQTVDPATGVPRGIADLHVGVITSSLGSFGTSACDPALGAENNDKGHLLPRPGEGPFGRAVSAAPLKWVLNRGKDPSASYVGPDGATALSTDTTKVVRSADSRGCGYEASLESVYHFLIDPAPYASAAASCTTTGGIDSCTGDIVVSGVDTELLAERAAFLRSDSLLAVIVLTDENDASLAPKGKNWQPWALLPRTMPRGWAACADVPDSVEDNDVLKSTYNCTSCALDPADVNCKLPWPIVTLNVDADGQNLRGAQQIHKYGYEFLWPISRYVAGFTASVVIGSDGRLGANPIFQGGFRTQDLVIFATITGVPEDLVANPDHTIKTLGSSDWAKIVDDNHGVRDPRMLESVAPRVGVLKYRGGGDLSASPYDGSAPFFNGNGGDRDIADGDDLQYACIQKRTSSAVSLSNEDCSDASTAIANPLCVHNSDGTYNQDYYKAYPGLRQLRLAHALGSSGFAASICAQSYAPAVQGIIDKINAAVDASCIDIPVNPTVSTSAPCVLAEAFGAATGPHGETRCEAIGHTRAGYCTPGAAPCRVAGSDFPPVSASDAAAGFVLSLTVTRPDGSTVSESVSPALATDGNVYAIGSDGVRHLVCEERQLTGADLTSCVSNPSFTTSSGGGWCYSTNPAVLGAACVSLGVAGTLRFVGTNKPGAASDVFAVCKRTCCDGS